MNGMAQNPVIPLPMPEMNRLVFIGMGSLPQNGTIGFEPWPNGTCGICPWALAAPGCSLRPGPDLGQATASPAAQVRQLLDAVHLCVPAAGPGTVGRGVGGWVGGVGWGGVGWRTLKNDTPRLSFQHSKRTAIEVKIPFASEAQVCGANVELPQEAGISPCLC